MNNPSSGPLDHCQSTGQFLEGNYGGNIDAKGQNDVLPVGSRFSGESTSEPPGEGGGRTPRSGEYNRGGERRRTLSIRPDAERSVDQRQRWDVDAVDAREVSCRLPGRVDGTVNTSYLLIEREFVDDSMSISIYYCHPDRCPLVFLKRRARVSSVHATWTPVDDP